MPLENLQATFARHFTFCQVVPINFFYKEILLFDFDVAIETEALKLLKRFVLSMRGTQEMEY